MGTIIYEFDEVEHMWLEECIMDGGEMNELGHLQYLPAEDYYEAMTDCENDASGIVHIRNTEDHKVFCSLHRHHAKNDAQKINNILSLRTKANFEVLFNFNGVYEPKITNTSFVSSSSKKKEIVILHTGIVIITETREMIWWDLIKEISHIEAGVPLTSSLLISQNDGSTMNIELGSFSEGGSEIYNTLNNAFKRYTLEA